MIADRALPVEQFDAYDLKDRLGEVGCSVAGAGVA